MYVIPLTKSGAIRNDTNTSQRDPTLISTGVDFNDYEMIEFFDTDYYYSLGSYYPVPVELKFKTYKAINVYCDTTLASKKVDNALCGSFLNPFIDFEDAYRHCVCLIRVTCCNSLFRIRVKGSINYFSKLDDSVPESFGGRILVSSYNEDKDPINLISDNSIWTPSFLSIKYYFSLYDTSLVTNNPILQSSIYSLNSNQYRSIGLYYIYKSTIQYYFIIDEEFDNQKDRIYFFGINRVMYLSDVSINVTHSATLSETSMVAYAGYFTNIFYNYSSLFSDNILCTNSNFYVYSSIGIPNLGWGVMDTVNIAVDVHHDLSLLPLQRVGVASILSTTFATNLEVEISGNIRTNTIRIIEVNYGLENVTIVSNTRHLFGTLYVVNGGYSVFNFVSINSHSEDASTVYGFSIKPQGATTPKTYSSNTILVNNVINLGTATGISSIITGVELYTGAVITIENSTIVANATVNTNYGGSCRTHAIHIPNNYLSMLLLPNTNKTATTIVNTAHLPHPFGWSYTTSAEAYGVLDTDDNIVDCYYISRYYDGNGVFYEEYNGCN